jgi:hypothetical protein
MRPSRNWMLAQEARSDLNEAFHKSNGMNGFKIIKTTENSAPYKVFTLSLSLKNNNQF